MTFASRELKMNIRQHSTEKVYYVPSSGSAESPAPAWGSRPSHGDATMAYPRTSERALDRGGFASVRDRELHLQDKGRCCVAL